MRRQRSRGATLVEILISLAVVLIGMAGMFRVLASSIVGSSASSHISQAQIRAQAIMESIRATPASGLICLAATQASSWQSCEVQCRGALALGAADTCIYTVATMANFHAPDTRAGVSPGTFSPTSIGQSADRSNQLYALSFTGDQGAKDSYVRLAGLNTRVYEIQITIGWNDNGTATPSATGYHTLTLHSGMFQ